LGPLAASIDHVGSTAVPNLGAKPKIDIMVGVEDEVDLDETITLMNQAGYTYFRIYEPWLPYRRMFAWLTPLGESTVPKLIDVGEQYVDGEFFRSTVHIHIFQKDSYHWKRHIAFRDFLRTHSDIREQYYALKLKLADQEFVDGADYNRHKAQFIARVETLAMDWYEMNK
jgi:GrpB-like predicted nucleotidyltransferase (UPF0157 family)